MHCAQSGSAIVPRPGPLLAMRGLSHTSLILLLCAACVGVGCLLGLLSWCVQRVRRKMRQKGEREGHRALSEERGRRRQRQQRRAQSQGTGQLSSVRSTRKINILLSALSAPADEVTSFATALQTSATLSCAGQSEQRAPPPAQPAAALADAPSFPLESRRAICHVNQAERPGEETRSTSVIAATATAAAVSAPAVDRHLLQLTVDSGDAPPDADVKHHVVDVRSEAAPAAAAEERHALSGPAKLSAASAADAATAAEEEGHEERAATADVDTPTLL